jgi:hypothetical protein
MEGKLGTKNPFEKSLFNVLKLKNVRLKSLQ